jgi:hypothetical protein
MAPDIHYTRGTVGLLIYITLRGKRGLLIYTIVRRIRGLRIYIIVREKETSLYIL